jgi:hypothetical protein
MIDKERERKKEKERERERERERARDVESGSCQFCRLCQRDSLY